MTQAEIQASRLAYFFLVAHCVTAQDVPYTFELNNQVYQPLEEYSVLPLGLGWDDPEVALPLPFDMVMWGDTCEFVATANVGEMLFCAGANGNHFIAPMTVDVCDLSVLDSTLQDVSELRHSLEGTAPDRSNSSTTTSASTTKSTPTPFPTPCNG